MIGLAAELSGPLSALGTGCRDAVTMAVEERNAAGGIKGARIELLVRDDGGDARRAVEADRELASRGAKVVIGHVTSTAASLVREEDHQRFAPAGFLVVE